MQKYTDVRLAVLVSAFASVGAGVIHLAVTPGHWAEWKLQGVFFAVLALFQIGWAGMVLRRANTGVIVLGVLANLMAMAMWVLSRAWGVPAGPAAGAPEAVGVADLVATFLEFFIVLNAAWFLLPRAQRAVLHAGGYRLAVGGAAVVVAFLVTPGVVAALDHGAGSHDHGGGQHGSGQHDDGPGAGNSPSSGASGHRDGPDKSRKSSSSDGTGAAPNGTPGPRKAGPEHGSDSHSH